MNKSRKKYYLYLLIFLFCSNGFSQNGGQAGEFLDLSVSTRSLGMGKCNISLIDDANSVFTNPGMLGTVYNIQFETTLGKYEFDRRFFDLAIAYPLGAVGNIGIGWTQFSIDDITGRDQYGYMTHNFSDAQSALVLSYGKMFGTWLSLGFSGKYLEHTLAGYSAKGYTFDFGSAIYLGDNITFAVAIKNMNSSWKWNTPSGLTEKLPLKFGTGATIFDLFGIHNLLFSSDIYFGGTSNFKYNLGMEYLLLNDMLILRSGFYENGLTFGGGVMLGGIKFDCGYSPDSFGDASLMHFTLSWNIIGSSAAPEVEYTEPVAEPEKTVAPPPKIIKTEEEKEKEIIVLITKGPLKFEKAILIKTNVSNNTATVRLLALPDSEPIILRMDQFEFVK